ncbi:MAG: hypothetical protein Q4B35_06585 [Slackia sp.]|nr:hypothetical protein [Slackia sp.]
MNEGKTSAKAPAKGVFSDETKAIYLIGWLMGFAPTVWAACALNGADGRPLFCDEAAASYETVCGELLELVTCGEGAVR